jgi:molecular chaperone DnaJ
MAATMTEGTFYDLLGLPADAPPGRVERSFRKLSRRFHPSLNPGDEDAARVFRDLLRAYRVLSDQESRAEYDRLGHAEYLRRQAASAPGPPAADTLVGATGTGIIADILGDGFPRLARRRSGEDVREVIAISLAEAVHGCARTVGYRRQAACAACGGSGAAPGGLVSCASCDAGGWVEIRRGPLVSRRECARCGGAGRVVVRPCKECGGAGIFPEQAREEIRVPAGVAPGAELRRTGAGHGGRDGSRGDLLVLVRIEDDPRFVRRGDTILAQVPVLVWEAALGARIRVETVDGPVTVTVRPGVQPGDQVRIRGKGAPNPLTGIRGDQVVELRIIVPPVTGEEMRRAYQALRDLTPTLPRGGARQG